MRRFLPVTAAIFATACPTSYVNDNCGQPSPSDPGSTEVDYGAHFYLQNFAYQSAPITPTIDVDFQSFTSQTTMDPTELDRAVSTAVAYWNDAGANFKFSTASVVCSDSDSTTTISPADRSCVDTTDGFSTVVLDHGVANFSGTAVRTAEYESRTIHDPNQPKDHPGTIHQCLVAVDLFFHDRTDDPCTPEGGGASTDIGEWTLNWVVWNTDVTDKDCSDGSKDYAFYDTLVHELGHFAGLSHPEASLNTSVMNDIDCSGCDWYTIGAADKASVHTLYP